ncbi:MAG: hypothetical protein LQ352_005500 [Teloschistes flavicans]|nr:MAG: hypothetical protein LQ352_005500 [Teloschistes flavicans]
MPSFFYHIALEINTSTTSEVAIEPTSFTHHTQSASQPGLPTTLQVSSAPQNRHITSPIQVKPNPTVRPDGSSSEATTEIGPQIHDWRLGQIRVQNIDMITTATAGKRSSQGAPTGHITDDIIAGHGGLATKGRFEPISHNEENVGWGVVRLYRDADDTPGLYDDPASTKSKNVRGSLRIGDGQEPRFRDEECTTLCILAVPSYLTPSDFLGFVGEKTRDEVRHFRMIRTEKGNRYMVLMKFRSGRRAREWRKEWNGKAFDSMEESFPDMSNDPFTPRVTITEPQSSAAATNSATSLSSASRSTKPMAPPTPSLVELPTCPVCLERMDESTGLLTILCQHVFHCTCLQKWRGSGCPVCRYTQDGPSKRDTVAGEENGLNECSICASDANLWICLICGNVGCGRYDAAHAFIHYQQTSHCFAMDMSSQRVWDYASDAYVHRLVQDKADGKLMELPASAADRHDSQPNENAWEHEDYVPREKLDNIGQEYTHLLTSQLESQRIYFAEALERAADKASRAAKAAENAEATARRTQEDLARLEMSHKAVVEGSVPSLERDVERSTRRASKFEGMARKLEKEWREEKALSGSLSERIKWLEEQVQTLTTEKADLQEQNRDLSFFISGGEKLKQLNGVDGEDIREGLTSVPDPPAAGKGKKKGKK